MAMSLMPAAAMAQSQTKTAETKSEKVDKKCPRKDKCERGDFRGKDGKRKHGKGGDRVCKEQCLFESLNLTDDQKAKVKSLNEARQVSRQELFEQVRKARAMNDTSFKADKNLGQEINRKYLKDLQTILTADQYVQFLENNYLESQSRHPKGDRMSKPGKMIKNPKNAKAHNKRPMPAASNISAAPAKK